jgi:Glycosyl transferase family 2
MRVHTLVRIDTRPITGDADEIRVFMNERDEMRRLPGFLDHYRKIGAKRFFITDNGSTDGSKEYLLAQPDCHVFVTRNLYSESNWGINWQNPLLDEYGLNRWCLMVDADEWFVYPGYERRSLTEFARYLEGTGSQGVFTFGLDMYGDGVFDESRHTSARSPLDECRYFDGEYAWHHRFHIPLLERPRFPRYNVVGGPRSRLLFPHLRRYYPLIRAMWRLRDIVRFPIPLALEPPNALTKIPFVRWLPGTQYLDSHRTTPIALSAVTGVLLHFKFLQDFPARVVTEATERGYSDRSRDYARYLPKLKDNRELGLHYSGSVKYESSEQLIQLGLLREDRAWHDIRAA